MPSETHRLADQIVRTYTGPMWHGPALADVLRGVTHEQAAQRPAQSAHTIWELVLHLTTWAEIPRERLGGSPRNNVGTDVDWPKVPAASAESWRAAVAALEAAHRALAVDVEALTDEQLDAKVAGHDYTVRQMLHGVVEHGTYHGGQIALLKKMLTRD